MDTAILTMGITLTGVVIAGIGLMYKQSIATKKEGVEFGKLLQEIKQMRLDINGGNTAMKEHLKFCRTQCEELILLKRSVIDVQGRVQKHDEKLSIHDRELRELAKLKEVRK